MLVSHNTLTERGFSISVVDLPSGTVIERIWGVQGLVTGFASARLYVYVAALGVRRPDFLYLYRIDLRTLQLEELYRIPKTEYRWEIDVHENRLYITYVRGHKGTAPPLVELMDTQTGRITQKWNSFAIDFHRFTEGVVVEKDNAYGPVMLPDGSFGIAVLETKSGSLNRLLLHSSDPCSVVGIRHGYLICTVSQNGNGANRLTVVFYNIRRDTTEYSVSINNHSFEEASR
jgi:hypothetical protein